MGAFLKIYEPFGQSAAMACKLAAEHCRSPVANHADCEWYHGAWQIFRLIGLITTICSDDDFFSRVLPPFCRNSRSKILVSGAADYALLARIVAAADIDACGFPWVTIVDRCATPLLLNQWYARQTSIPLAILQTDVLEYSSHNEFDLICTHSFLGFFSVEDRKRLVASWIRMLKPGGVVVTAQRVRPREQSGIIGYSPDQIGDFGRRARVLAKKHYDNVGFDPDLVEQLAIDYARRYTTHVISSVEELKSLFVDAGFQIKECSPPEKKTIIDHPGAPEDSSSKRWRIVAQKPRTVVE
jgi:hypothetical protein